MEAQISGPEELETRRKIVELVSTDPEHCSQAGGRVDSLPCSSLYLPPGSHRHLGVLIA